MNAHDLTEIPGRAIRRQYFNIFIYSILYICAMVLLITTVKGDGRYPFADTLKTTLALVLPVIAVLALISVFNRTRFGRIVAVLDDEGIHTECGFFRWEDIIAIRYTPSAPSRRRYTPNTAFLTVKTSPIEENAVSIPMAPLHLLFAARKYARHIKLGLTHTGIIELVLLLVLPILFSLFERL